MANSTSANLKLTVQATGENPGTWGQITNTNLLILEQAIGGYDALNVTNTSRALTFTNGALSNGKNEVIKLTGTITGNIDVVIPDSVEKTYIVENGTSGAFTVTFAAVDGISISANLGTIAKVTGNAKIFPTGLNLTTSLGTNKTLIWNQVDTGTAPVDPPGWQEVAA